MKKSVKISNGKGFLHVDESIQIPTDFKPNEFIRTYIGYYVGTSFRIVRTILPINSSEIWNEILKLQVDFKQPLVAVNLHVGVSRFNII